MYDDDDDDDDDETHLLSRYSIERNDCILSIIVLL